MAFQNYNVFHFMIYTMQRLDMQDKYLEIDGGVPECPD